MEPTFHEGDVIVVEPLEDELKRFDIIAYWLPGSTNKDPDYINRLIGLPGETIEVHEGYVFIDGLQLDEPYLFTQSKTVFGRPYLVPDNYYFVMGDNREHSMDSRGYGPVYIGDIVGIVAN
jgi:signal peptidase I